MSMPDAACQHERTRLIAKDDESQYVECLDCGAILEAAELPGAKRGEADENRGQPKEVAGFDESLSDA
jgi:hypothetical protein